MSTTNTPGPLPGISQSTSIDSRTNSSTNYIYQYGIKNIAVSNSTYEPSGVFVTKPIEVKGNIVEVSLSSVEDHPSFDELDGMATNRVTSIEYYVSLEENPSANDWMPILPEEVKKVTCEKLFFKGSSADLRFHADISDIENTKVYRDNIVMSRDDWYFTNRGSSIQLTKTPSQGVMYTIDYVPDTNIKNPWTIEVGDTYSKQVRVTETFPNGTDYNNSITLSNYPYIDYDAINEVASFDPNTNDYRPIDVFLKNASIAAGNGQTKTEIFPMAYSDTEEYVTKNRTDYKASKDVSLNKYSIVPGEEYKVFEYKQEKNKLIFTESFNRADLYHNEATNHGNASIEVHYDYLVTNFRLKIILRKNTGDNLVVTPMVNSYQLKFKVMK